MDENIELLEYIYKNSEMAVFTLNKLIRDLNGLENKIKKTVQDEIIEYEKFLKTSKKLIKKSDEELKSNGIMAKMGASMGIKKEVDKDNSDAAIAHMLTEGITMGIVDMETKIKNYSDSVDRKVIKLAKDFLKYQQEELERLKEFM